MNIIKELENLFRSKAETKPKPDIQPYRPQSPKIAPKGPAGDSGAYLTAVRENTRRAQLLPPEQFGGTEAETIEYEWCVEHHGKTRYYQTETAYLKARKRLIQDGDWDDNNVTKREVGPWKPLI